MNAARPQIAASPRAPPRPSWAASRLGCFDRVSRTRTAMGRTVCRSVPAGHERVSSSTRGARPTGVAPEPPRTNSLTPEATTSVKLLAPVRHRADLCVLTRSVLGWLSVMSEWWEDMFEATGWQQVQLGWDSVEDAEDHGRVNGYGLEGRLPGEAMGD